MTFKSIGKFFAGFFKIGFMLACAFLLYAALEQVYIAQLDSAYNRGLEDGAVRCYNAHARRLQREDLRPKKRQTSVAANLPKIPKP